MRYLILIGNDDFSIKSIEKIKHSGSTKKYIDPNPYPFSNSYIVEYGTNNIRYDFVDISKDYDLKELERIPFETPVFVMMVYKNSDIVKKIIQEKTFPNNIYIDNDHGLIASLEEFINLGMPLD